jgi:hypothetical protein
MKKLMLITLMGTYAMGGFTSITSMQSFSTTEDNKRLCKFFIKKSHSFQITMDNSKSAQATFNSYKDRVVNHCAIVASNTTIR